MAHAVAILGNPTDAEDALQEAFLDAYRARAQLLLLALHDSQKSVLEAGGQPQSLLKRDCLIDSISGDTKGKGHRRREGLWYRMWAGLNRQGPAAH